MIKKISALLLVSLIASYLYGQTTHDYILKAKALTEAGKAVQANELLTEAIALAADVRLYVERAESRTKAGDLSGAISDLNAANGIVANSGEYGLARVYSMKGDAPTSVYHLERNMGSLYRRPEKEVMLDMAFRTVENSPEWRRLWKKEWYSKSEKSLSEIEYYISVENHGEARNILNTIKAIYPGSDEVAYGEAILSCTSGKYQEAFRLAEQLSAAHPESEKYLRLLMKCQIETSNPAGATTTITRLFELGIPDAQLYLQRAECFRRTGEVDKAIADVSKFLDLYPGNMAAISMAGKLEVTAGDNLRAIELFSANIKLHPNDPECYIDRANSYFVAKSWKWAADDYGMALDLNPGKAEVWLNKGVALLNSGNTEDACHDFRRSLSLGNRKAADYISRNCIK